MTECNIAGLSIPRSRKKGGFKHQGRGNNRFSDPGVDVDMQMLKGETMNKFEKFCIAGIMNNKRKVVLSVLGVLGTLVIAELGGAFLKQHGILAVAADGGTVAPELEGTWRVTIILPSGDPPIQAFHTFSRGGVMMESNALDRSSPGSQTPGHGVWRRTGPHTFGFTLEKLQFDLAGNFVGKLKVREVDQLNKGLDSYNGIATAEVFDSSGNLLLSFCVRTQASRMRVESPQCP
jgi:hypothetical protein